MGSIDMAARDAQTAAPATAPTVEIFTDGACLGNPGPGGWAALLRRGAAETEIEGGEALTTNNRMELIAAIRALEALEQPSRARVYTDSRYVADGIRSWLPRWKANGWRTAARKPVRNADLWRALDGAAQRHTVEWIWVRGHAGCPENERVDRLARAAARAAAETPL